MQIQANTPEEYISKLPEDRQEVMKLLHETIRKNLPEGFKECIGYGMIGYVVPNSIYPAGYHCDPKLPLPFMNLASQKNFIAIYHMGLYADKMLMDWFMSEYPKHCKLKPDMGKSCLRFKKMDQIPYKLIGELAGKMTVAAWIEKYESNFKSSKKEK
ncbi:MAG: DUF1801 domain-containing protein [Bacteroidales bacterium]